MLNALRKENYIPHQQGVECTDSLCKTQLQEGNKILTFFLLISPFWPLDCSIIRSTQLLPAKIAKLKSEYYLVIPQLLLLTIVSLWTLLLIFLWYCSSMPFSFLGVAAPSFSVRRSSGFRIKQTWVKFYFYQLLAVWLSAIFLNT